MIDTPEGISDDVQSLVKVYRAAEDVVKAWNSASFESERERAVVVNDKMLVLIKALRRA